jgi:hypothetical protein
LVIVPPSGGIDDGFAALRQEKAKFLRLRRQKKNIV